MTTPVAEGYATTDDTGRSTTTLSLNIPTGVQVNEVLYACVTDVGASPPTFPAGWTTFWSETSTYSSNSVSAAGAWKYATGSETGTISVTVSTNGACGIMYRISGCANPNLEPPVANTIADQRDSISTGDYCPGIEVYPTHNLMTNDYLVMSSLHQYSLSNTLSKPPQDLSSVVNIAASTAGQMWIGHRNATAPMEYVSIWDYTNSIRASLHAAVMFFPRVRTVFSTTHPYVRSIACTSETGRITSTSYKLKLPRVINKGDLLFAVIAQFNVSAPQVAWPSDWTELFDTQATENPSGDAILCSAAWKIADGSEGVTITLPVVAEATTCGKAYSIGNVADGFAPEYEEDAGNLGGLATITPSYGSGNYLILSIDATEDRDWGGERKTIEEWPNVGPWEARAYSHSKDDLNPALNCVLFSCWGEYTGTGLDPGGFNLIEDNAPQNSIVVAFYGGTPADTDWWYLAWEGKVRGAFM